MRKDFNEQNDIYFKTNFESNQECNSKLSVPKASKSASNFFTFSRNKIRNRYSEEIEEKLDNYNKYKVKELKLKIISNSKIKNYNNLMTPPTSYNPNIFGEKNN